MNSQINPSNFYGGVPDTPLMLFQPFNIIVFLSFYSPLVIAICMVSMSFVFQNFKGLIYLGYLIGVCVVRSYVYMLSGAKPIENDRTICSSIQFSKYGNGTFSSFVFAFTIMYLCLPMFTNNAVNFWIFTSMISYFLIDIFIKMYKKCIVKMTDLFLNILLGLASAALIVSLMYLGGSSQYLFFNEVSSNNDVCTMPSKQTFKCKVYKNGELIGTV